MNELDKKLEQQGPPKVDTSALKRMEAAASEGKQANTEFGKKGEVESYDTKLVNDNGEIKPLTASKEEIKKVEENNLDYGVDEEYCPLIIYSKTISNQFECFDEAYQMDAYSTLLNVLGYNDYYWKGFGVNLLDSVARKNRPISEQEAFILSDKLIRANWFESYTKEKQQIA